MVRREVGVPEHITRAEERYRLPGGKILIEMDRISKHPIHISDLAHIPSTEVSRQVGGAREHKTHVGHPPEIRQVSCQNLQVFTAIKS